MDSLAPRGPSGAPQEALSSASKLLNDQVQRDRQYPDIISQLRVQSDAATNVSGYTDNDYPAFASYESLQRLVSMPHIGEVNHIPLPHELVEQFNNTQCSCYMGLFPQIGRAWLSIDSNIYLWNFEDGSDLAYFDGMSEAISCSGLTRPKMGVFQERIQYLLCIATAVEIVILGVGFSALNGNDFGEMHLQPEPLFTLSTNNAHVSSFETADNGRIFVCCRDGSLNEIMYQAQDGWFTPRCRLVNCSKSKLSFLLPSFLSIGDDDPLVQVSVDGSRNILYTRSDHGTISVYDLGRDGFGMSKIASLDQDAIARRAALAARTPNDSLFKPLIHISAIKSSESPFLHLVAISSSGIRLYFTCSFLQPGSQVNPAARPAHFSLVHCRLPPGFSPSTASERCPFVNSAFYSQGTLILASYKSENVDSVYVIHPDSFPFPPSENILHESFVSLAFNGRSLAIAEIPTDPFVFVAPVGRANVPCAVSQHIKPARKYVILSTQGTHIVDQMRPVDQLRHLLMQSQSGTSESVEAFFQLHKPDQACAMCLILASSTAAIDHQVAVWAAVAFLHYGGEPQLHFPGPLPPSGPQLVIGTQSPIGPSMSPGMLGGAVIGPDMHFSGKHDGLCIYFSRIIVPVWEVSLVSEANVASSEPQSRFSPDELEYFLERLGSLNEFLERNPHFANTTQPFLNGTSHQPGLDFIQGSQDAEKQKKYQADAFAKEANSLRNVVHLLRRSIECLALWKTICNHGFAVVVMGMTREQKDLLRSAKFKEIVESGKELCMALISSLMSQHINDQAETSTLSTRLCSLCPSLFSPDDAVVAKAYEVFTLAKGLQNPQEKFKTLGESLKLFSKVTQRIDLASVAKQFEEVGYYEGVVDLALVAAKQADQQDHALHFFKTGQPVSDQTGHATFKARINCYKCVIQCLDNLLTASKSVHHLPAQSQGSGQNVDIGASKKLEAVLQRSLNSSDELFHVAVYDWLVNENELDRLLEIRTSFLEDYLKERASSGDVAMMDLLWKFYEKGGNFAAAAQILSKLAEGQGININLEQRIVYLSRAVVTAKSCSVRTSASAEGEFLHELEEKLEVAHIQRQILHALEQSGLQQMDKPIEFLNADLMDISKLYGDYADQFDLFDCKLAILHSASYHDPALIENVWGDVLKRELDKSKNRDPTSRVEMMRAKLTQLGKLYFQSERYFPLSFLLTFLEERSCQLSWRQNWTFETFQRIGVSMPRLHAFYDRLFKSKDPRWLSYGKPLHVLEVIYLLLSSFEADQSQVQACERHVFLSICLDAVSTYLVELQSMPTTDPKVQQTIVNFDSLKKLLQRGR